MWNKTKQSLNCFKIVVDEIKQICFVLSMSNTKRLAQWVADSMKEDGITARALAYMSLAYVDSVGKKIENMQSQLLTMPDTRPIFTATIRSLL